MAASPLTTGGEAMPDACTSYLVVMRYDWLDAHQAAGIDAYIISLLRSYAYACIKYEIYASI